MGLLDSILGGVAGNVLGSSGGMLGSARSGRGSGSNILMALLPVVLGMLANRGGMGGGASPSAGAGPLGGLGGMGGLGALLDRFQQSGFGDQVQSWISTGENKPIPAEALTQVFDANELSQIASQAGLSEDEARTGLSQLLPQVVDQLTPQGQVPESDQLLSSIDQFERELGQRS